MITKILLDMSRRNLDRRKNFKKGWVRILYNLEECLAVDHNDIRKNKAFIEEVNKKIRDLE